MSCAVFHVVYVCVCLMRECSTCSMTMYSDYVHTSIKGIVNSFALCFCCNHTLTYYIAFTIYCTSNTYVTLRSYTLSPTYVRVYR